MASNPESGFSHRTLERSLAGLTDDLHDNRVVAEIHPRQDRSEVAPVALRVVALARQ